MDEMLYFRKNALLANLCKEWSNKWAACHDDKEKLMRLVLMQQSAPYFADFCYRGKGLTKDYCKREFSDYINGRIFNDCDTVNGFSYTMYIDAPTGFKIVSDVAQFLWCDSVDVTIPKTKCPILYVSNSSTIHITCDGYNCPHIYLFDDSKVAIDDADEDSKVVIYKYSDKAQVELGKYCLADVKVFDKQLKL
jgi:hypothetical protein